MDLAAVAGRKSVTVSDLKQRADEIHQDVGHAGQVYALRFGDHEGLDDLEKLIRHNPALAVRLITEHIPAITRDPKAAGEKKQDELSRLRACGFTFRGVAYRVVYELDDARRLVAIVAIGVHDVAYRPAQGR